MNKLVLLSACLFFSMSSYAICKKGDDLYSRSVKSSLPAYEHCALFDNDEDAQVRLGNIYKNGEKNAQKNEMKALLFYHLASDAGNAYAQTELAKIMMQMDADPTKRAVLKSYMDQAKEAFKDSEDYSFKGEVLHPFVLLMLAAEPAEQKWYYPTKNKYSSEAVTLLKSYQLSEDQKKAFMYAGSLWKQRKMMETAKEVLAPGEYQSFEKTLFPKQGKADPFLRKQVVNNLKEKVENYLK